jgi:hypothetical protein
MAIAGEKLGQFLSLADEILTLRQQIQETLDQQGTGFRDTLRKRVLIGLNLKALDSFDRLVVDAREQRGECSHHLKTMAECFIYSGWVSADSGETRAKLILADGYRSRAAYHQAIGDEDMAADWQALRRHEVTGLEAEWAAFKRTKIMQMAVEARREEHYYQVYRLACEAAHLGDLNVYIPPQPEERGLCFADMSLMRAYICLKFGIALACDLLHDASDALKLQLGDHIEGFRTRWKAIITIGAT